MKTPPTPLVKKILWMIALNLVYSGSGALVLSFINKYLLTLSERDFSVLGVFFALLVIFLALSVASRAALCRMENDFIYDLRTKIIKQIIDTKFEKIERASKSNLLASLSSDISNLTQGFMHSSELVQGAVVVLFSGAYIFYLDSAIFCFLCVWIGALMALNQLLMRRVFANFALYRAGEDALYAHYAAAIEGHKELSLSPERARALYEKDFLPNAATLRSTSLKAQIYQAFAGNFVSVMMLGAVGAVLFWELAGGSAGLANAVTIALTVLFLRAPLMMLVFSLPSLLRARIAYNKILALNLDPWRAEFDRKAVPEWSNLELKNVNFTYPNGKFALKNVNMSVKRGERVFLVGKNGSGKSTLFMVLAGLYTPQSGEILINGTRAGNLNALNSGASAVFSDFYLFERVVGDEEKALELIEIMGLGGKVEIKDGKFTTLNLSQGQKKRLAMISALLEGRKFLMLDEWAADQDPSFRARFYTEFLPRLSERGYTVFAISHDDRYFDCADKIYKMENGELSQIK